MAEIELDRRIRNFLDSAIRKSTNRDYARALDDLKAAELLDRDNPAVLYNLGICYTRTGLHAAAVAYFKRLLLLPSTFVEVITVKKLLAYCLIMDGGHAIALTQLEECLTMSRRDAAAMNMKGYCLEHLGKYAEAIEVFRDLLELDPHNSNAWNSMAYLLALSGGDLNEALRFAKAAVDASPDNPAYLDTIGYVYLKRNQGDVAKNFLKKALALMPDSEDIKTHLNELLKINGA